MFLRAFGKLCTGFFFFQDLLQGSLSGLFFVVFPTGLEGFQSFLEGSEVQGCRM